MTRDEAIFILKRDNPNNIAIRSGFESLYDQRKEAFSMAIKALEQEPVLDKIRAEIESKCCITVGRENDGAITLHDVFEIIDKYMAESEV